MCALSAQAKANLKAWQGTKFDATTRQEVAALIKQGDAAIEDAFGSSLLFGTAGLRGLMGVGPNRLNRYTIALATEGLARFLKKHIPSPEPHRILIGYDSRHNSAAFAMVAARVLAAHGCDVHLFAQMRPTPWVSFGVRHLKCHAGIMITASHNPAAYNGYKVYGPDGGQIVAPYDTGILEAMKEVQEITAIPMASPEDEHILQIFDELDDDYITAIQPLQNRPHDNLQTGSALRVLYSSLHGTGITVIDKVLANWGFTQLTYVASQIIPDGDFPTASYPNPEKPEAMRLGLEQLMHEHADLLIVNDPDADRIGVACLQNGAPVSFTGNQLAMLVVHYLGELWRPHHPKVLNPAVVKTIVTSEGVRAVAQQAGMNCFDVLTGFKFIGHLIGEWEQTHAHTFLFGGEESYGALYGTQTRDKDGICMAALVCEIALYCKQQGLSLADYWDTIEQKLGVYRNGVLSIEFPETEEGHQKIAAMMQRLRSTPPQELGGDAVVETIDYQQPQPPCEVELPLANVLRYRLASGATIIARPSGTEPKIKLYAGTVYPCTKTDLLATARQAATTHLAALLKATEGYCQGF